MAFSTSTYRGPPSHPRLVGREPELNQLRHALRQATRGDGGLALVSGEAGIGKTSLIQALIREAHQHGILVLTGAAYDLSATPPYGPWLEITDRYPEDQDVPELPEILKRGTGIGDMQSQLELFAYVRDFFLQVSGSRPLLLVVEDLHWADQASLDLLRYLARQIDGENVLLVGSYRDDEVTRHHPLFQLLPVLVRESEPLRVSLRPLTTSDVVELVTGRYSIAPAVADPLASYLTARSEGNPLFLLEMLRSMDADGTLSDENPRRMLAVLDQIPLPPLIRQVIEARVTRLGPITVELLEAASVIGETVAVDLWQSVSRTDEHSLADAVAQAMDAHLIEECSNAESVRFTHALIREVLYDRIPAPRKRSLHRTIGDALVERPGGDADAIAFHFHHGGDNRAVEWLTRAGMRAREHAAWISAAERFASAAELLADDDDRIRERGWLFFYAGYLLRFTTGDKPIEYHQKAERAALAAGDELLAAYALYSRGSTRGMRPTLEMRAGLIELRQGVQALENLAGDHRLRSADKHSQAMIRSLLLNSDPDDSFNCEATRHTPTPRTVPQKAVLISRLAQAGHYLESLQMGEEFVAGLASDFGETWRTNNSCLDVFSGLANDYAAIGNPDAARQALSTARSAFLSAGDHAMVEFMTWVELNMVIMPYRTDHLEERANIVSLASIEWNSCREVTVSGGSTEAPSSLIIHELEGNWRQAWDIAVEQEQSHPWKAYVAQAMLIQGRISHYRGNPESAWTFVHRLLPEGPTTEPGNSYFLTSFDALALGANLCLDAGDPEQARRWITARDHWLQWSGARLWNAENLLLWASYSRAIGAREKAFDYATRALTEASAPRQPLTQLRIRRLLGDVCTALKQHDLAFSHLEESLALADSCAAPYERALTQLALAELHSTTGNQEQVTPLCDDVRSFCEPRGAQPALDRMFALLPTAAKPPSPALQRSGTLTERETEVLRQIARGKSNRQIADEMFISTRTVERHVANIYTKIRVHNRVEATAYALQQELT